MDYNNQIPQQFAGNLNAMQNNGGYPIGYPPVMSQSIGYGVGGIVNNQPNPFVSPFPQPQPMMPVPGVTAPLELSDNRGNTVVVPPSAGFNQGGATVSQGGFNPVTGTVSQPAAGQGFNPYTKFIGNPGYNVQGYGYQQQYQYPQQQGFSPYYPGANRPFMQPYGYGYYGYGQNEFDRELQAILYEQEPSAMDTRQMLEQVILTEEEREKINHNRGYVTGIDYYGKPIYSNGNYAYQINQQRQQEFEQSRHAWQAHFTMLSKIAHGYYGEQIDEESAMKFFDPVPQQPINNQKIFNYYNATEDEKKEYARRSRLQATFELDQQIQRYEMFKSQLDAQKEAAYAQIKASHDRLIGVEPGQHYDLKTFMDNGYKLGVNIAMKQSKSANRNGTNKYSRNDYRASLSQVNNTPVPVTSKDDEYVSIEQMLKSVYDRNKMSVNSIIRDPNNGKVSYTGQPVLSSEYEAHQYFLQAMQDKKAKDDVRRAVL